MLSSEIKQKVKNTNLKKYGSEYYVLTDEFKNKSKATCKSKYGVDYAMQNTGVREKQLATCMLRYGVDNAMQNSEILHSTRKKYTYNDIHFDSSWEIALWIYASDHKEEIVRCPISFEYYVDNKKHYYFPDFLYNGKLIEIKGDHFFNKEGILIDKFNNQSNEKQLAKFNCAINNNVIFWKFNDIKFALDYVKQTYGKNYLKQFKNKC